MNKSQIKKPLDEVKTDAIFSLKRADIIHFQFIFVDQNGDIAEMNFLFGFYWIAKQSLHNFRHFVDFGELQLICSFSEDPAC